MSPQYVNASDIGDDYIAAKNAAAVPVRGRLLVSAAAAAFLPARFRQPDKTDHPRGSRGHVNTTVLGLPFHFTPIGKSLL